MMKAQPALVGSDGVIALNAITAINTYIAIVIFPADTKGNDPVRLCHALKNTRISVQRSVMNPGNDGSRNFMHCLVELFFAGISTNESFHKTLHFLLNT